MSDDLREDFVKEEKRKIAHEYEKLIFEDLRKRSNDESKTLLNVFYHSKYPYHEALLFHILKIPSFNLSNDQIHFAGGVSIDRI